MAGFDELWLDPIYATALKPSLWPGLLERLCVRIGAVAGSINRINPVDGKASLFFEHGTDPVYSAKLLTTYAAISPIGSAVLIAGIDEPLTAFDFIDEDEYRASRFYTEWCRPQGYYDMLGAILAKSPTAVGAISTVRTLGAGRYGAEERAFVGSIAPHVRRAVTISGLLEAQNLEREALTAIMDALTAAAFIVDGNSRLTRYNPAANALIARGDFAVRDGMLTAADAGGQATLRAALTIAERPTLVSLQGVAGPLIAAVLPVRAGGPFAIIVNAQTPDSEAIGGALLQAFNFTRRELTVLLPLLRGQTIEAVADELGIEVATARSHLHKIFAKTGTTRQGELIQKVLHLLPPVTDKA